MANDEPKKPEGKFSEVARKSREKRAEMEQRKRDETQVFPERGATEERRLKIASGTHGWFTFRASVRRFGLELDRQPAAYLLAVCPQTFS